MANCCAVVMAILLPPVGVAMVDGCGLQLLINLLLCLLGWIPGIVHALFVVLVKKDKPVEQHIHHHQAAPAPGTAMAAPAPAHQPSPNPPYPAAVGDQPMAAPPGTQYPPQQGVPYPPAAGQFPAQPVSGYPANDASAGYPPRV